MMLLSQANKALRANPIMKLLVKARPEDHSVRGGADKEYFDALHEVAAQYPILARYVSVNDFTHFWWGQPYNEHRSYGREIYLMMLELNRHARGSVTSHAKKELLQWANSNGVRRSLSHNTQTEMEWVEGIHPTAPVTLYRGLLFGKNSFREGITEARDARIFINALMHGHTSLQMAYKWPQSWTEHKRTADSFARKNSASSEYGAMMNWLHNGKKFIDRDLGLIISSTVAPKDILCDFSKINLGHLNHGDEGEFIVRPDAVLQVQIEHIYTPAGEVNVQEFMEYMNNIASKAA